VPSSVIGESVMRELAKLDEVAYVRFASVYRSFKDLGEFMSELKELISERKSARRSDPAELMRLALAEAEKGRAGRIQPAVGALVVRRGKVIARGHHEKAGLPHAEVNALRAAGGRARGADVYVTLEPCNHQGRTPPCTQALIAAGVRRVFFGSRDPNPLVEGHAPIGCTAPASKCAAGSWKRTATDRTKPGSSSSRGPALVVLKAAITLDGKLALRPGGRPPSARRRPAARPPLARRDGRRPGGSGNGAGRRSAADGARRPRRAQPASRRPRTVPRRARMLRQPGETVAESGPLRPCCAGSPGGASPACWSRRHRGARRIPEDGTLDELRLFVAPKIFGKGGLSWAGQSRQRRPLDRVVQRVGVDVLLIVRHRPLSKPGL